jgi:hypothetical protein
VFSARIPVSNPHNNSTSFLLETENGIAIIRISPEYYSIGYYRVEIGMINHF